MCHSILTFRCCSCFRSSLNWKLVCNKAAEMDEEMAYKAPDLKERMRYPRCRNDLYDVMPIRSRCVCAHHTGARASFFQHNVTCTVRYSSINRLTCWLYDLILLAFVEGGR